MDNGYSLADIAAATGNNSNSGFGDGNGWWIILLFIFIAAGGWGNNGGFFGGAGAGSGAAENYVLASDFATLQRMIGDSTNIIERKLDGITNGLCDGFYTQAQLINGTNQTIMQNGYETRSAIAGIGSQMAQCCCDIREGISGVNYNLATQACGIGRQIENGFAQTNYNMASQNCATLQAIDKVGDRVIDYLANQEAQKLRDENAALRLAASQQAQNAYLVDALGTKCPIPAYLTCNPNAPLNYSVQYGNGGCSGCGCGNI